ncbi:MAG: universal stress protein [Deltaproteobacteria bacterium]|nr:universal stress protein [Deltaproteobacteria bacterium]
MKKNLFKEIAFCTDFSENANEAFLTAKDLASRYGANLHIMHVVLTIAAPATDFFIPEEHDAKFVEKATHTAQGSIEELYLKKLPKDQNRFVYILPGYPATEIIEIVKEKNIGLIVMGAHGLTGLAHVLFGSTANRVVRKAPCSVLTVRPSFG